MSLSEHFRTFSFVDRITSMENGSRIEGRYAISSDLRNFPSSLAAESVGQLAAWAAMKATGFERRPVAGLAGKIELLAAPQPGQELELSADIESLDTDAVAYNGAVTTEGKLILRLEDCVGPMIPVADLDDPIAVRERFELISGGGAVPGVFESPPLLPLQRTGGEKGLWGRATLQVPASAPWFADHFPRRPVFPGSLLMQSLLELASALADEIPRPPQRRWTIQSIHDMKLREFISPGKNLELEARLKQSEGESLALMMSARIGKETAGGARLLLKSEAAT
jgi:3-hydroxymyristoyl/3-hydroxydecanoyl-(acyl carrier protein) dehydratase